MAMKLTAGLDKDTFSKKPISGEVVSAGISAAAGLATGLISASQKAKDRRRRAKAKVTDTIQRSGNKKSDAIGNIASNFVKSIRG